MSAISGLGGIGKSTLAAALAHDFDVQTLFPDGILWVTLGQTPDLLPHLGNWIKTLGDYNYKPITVNDASMHLQTLLYDKKALLVVDDAWNPEHVEPFRVGGSDCRVLVTTREAHSQLLERYQKKTKSGLWHTLEDDGYIYANLSWHLEQAQRVEDLHQLLQEETETGHNGWYETCDRLGQNGIFVTDIGRGMNYLCVLVKIYYAT